ncbi:hypothetical protein FDK15_13955, partial [Geobacillus thermoleovorans]
KLLYVPCVSRIHSTSERKNPPDFRREGAKCESLNFSQKDSKRKGTRAASTLVPSELTGMILSAFLSVAHRYAIKSFYY